MSDTFTYRRGAERPNLTLPWQEQTAAATWTDLDLSSGFTFTATLTNTAGTVVVTKTTGITGANGSVTIAWAADELDIAPTTYTLHVRATTGGVDRDYSPADPVKIIITA